MKIATLGLITKEEKILLGLKKTGEIGTGTLNGPGGKCEKGEPPVVCVIREIEEEVGIQVNQKDLTLVALITFFDAGEPDFKVFVYRIKKFIGEPQETADMIPGWYDIKNLPFDRMLESDREWFPKVLGLRSGKVLRAEVYYKKRAKEFERIKFQPLP